MQKGKAIIFSAPSGSGKTTIVRNLLKNIPSLEFSISATSRSPRQNETHEHDYYFLSVADFKNKIEHGEFIEWEEVYVDNYYGTLKSEVERIWLKGHHVIFDVDVKGGLSLKKYFGTDALAVFVTVSDLDTLKERLIARGSETPESLERRLSKAEYEMSHAPEFDISILNVELEKSFAESIELVNDFINTDAK